MLVWAKGIGGVPGGPPLLAGSAFYLGWCLERVQFLGPLPDSRHPLNFLDYWHVLVVLARLSPLQ